jgi:hypothetical protein
MNPSQHHRLRLASNSDKGAQRADRKRVECTAFVTSSSCRPPPLTVTRARSKDNEPKTANGKQRASGLKEVKLSALLSQLLSTDAIAAFTAALAAKSQ